MPKLEMDEESSVALCICTVTIAIAIVLLYLIHQSYSVEREAIQAGLVQQSISPGSVTKIWVKPDTVTK